MIVVVLYFYLMGGLLSVVLGAVKGRYDLAPHRASIRRAGEWQTVEDYRAVSTFVAQVLFDFFLYPLSIVYLTVLNTGSYATSWLGKKELVP